MICSRLGSKQWKLYTVLLGYATVSVNIHLVHTLTTSYKILWGANTRRGEKDLVNAIQLCLESRIYQYCNFARSILTSSDASGICSLKTQVLQKQISLNFLSDWMATRLSLFQNLLFCDDASGIIELNWRSRLHFQSPLKIQVAG